MGKNLAPILRDELMTLLREYKYVFAWSHEKMPRIDDSVVTHKPCVDLTVRLVKQKRRTFDQE